jgi:hypothetical protein
VHGFLWGTDCSKVASYLCSQSLNLLYFSRATALGSSKHNSSQWLMDWFTYDWWIYSRLNNNDLPLLTHTHTQTHTHTHTYTHTHTHTHTQRFKSKTWVLSKAKHTQRDDPSPNMILHKIRLRPTRKPTNTKTFVFSIVATRYCKNIRQTAL